MSIEEKLIHQIKKTGFRLTEVQDDYFSSILTRKILFADNVFALTTHKEGESIDDIIEKGRAWNIDNLSYILQFIASSGLNLVIFHKGELGKADITGKCDSLGFVKYVLLLSITLINTTDNKTEQDTTWILLPRIKKTLKNITKFEINL